MKEIVAKLQNFMYYFGSKNFKVTQNKIFMIGSYQKFSSIIKELNKNQDNIIIRGSTVIGRSLFRKDVDYYITFKNSEDYIRKKIKDFNVIVTTNNLLPFEKKVIRIANELNIPSIVIQHGIAGDSNLRAFQSIPLVATKMAAWGKITKNLLVKEGEDKDKIIITGAPQFDEYITKKPEKREKILKKFKIPSSKKIILFTAQPFINNVKPDSNKLTLKEQKDIFNNLFNVAKELDLFLIIKLHPNNNLNIKEISKFIPKIGYKDYSLIKHKPGDLFDLISICDVLVTYSSTTAIEAMLLKKPVITVNFSNKKDTINYAKYGCAIKAHNKKILKKTIISILDDMSIREELRRKSKKYLKNALYKIDGLSSKRATKLIINTIKRK